MARLRVTKLPSENNVVWREGKYVYKLPRPTTLHAYNAELAAVSTAQVAAAAAGFAPAAVVPPNPALVRRAPDRVHAGATTMPVLRLEWQPGMDAFDAFETGKLHPAGAAEAIVQHNAVLVRHGWCSTDTKLENIILRDDGALVFIDWGSLCMLDSEHATSFTHAMQDHQTPLKLMVINMVVTLGELAGEPCNPNLCISPKEFKSILLRLRTWLPPRSRNHFWELVALATLDAI